MKRSVLVLAAAIAAGAYAAPEKILELELADQDAVIAAAVKVGQFSGFPTLGPIAMMGIANNAFVSDVGPLRAGARARAVIFVDSVPKTASTFCDVASHTFFVVLYPANKTKAQFMEAKGKAAKDEGLFVKYDGMAYQFSNDGKWVAFSEVKNANIAKEVLASAEATRPFAEGDVVRLTVTEKGFGLAVDLMNSPEVKAKLQEEMPNGRYLADIIDVVASLSSLEVVLRVSDLGVDLLSTCAMKPGSKYEHLGNVPLSSATPLAFAGRDSVYASAFGKGLLSCDYNKYISGFKSIFEKRGIDLRFLDVAKAGSVTTVSLDLQAAIAFFTNKVNKTAIAKAFENETAESITGELSSIVPTALFNQPEQAFSLRIKGLTSYAAPAERITRAVPDMGARKYNFIAVGSLYSIARGVLGIVADTVADAQHRESIKGILATLPPETGADIVMLGWREGADNKGIVRFTPAEIKGLCVAVSAGSAFCFENDASTVENAVDDDDDDDD